MHINDAPIYHKQLRGANGRIAFNYVKICGRQVIPVVWDIAKSSPPMWGEDDDYKNRFYWSSDKSAPEYNPISVEEKRFQLLGLWLLKKDTDPFDHETKRNLENLNLEYNCEVRIRDLYGF